MKIKYLLTLAIAGSAILTGCKKDFLETEPTQFLTADQLANAAKTDPKVFAGTLNGLYVNMYNPGTGGTSNHDDFGQKGYDIYMDLLSSDMVLGATVYGWYSNIARMTGNVDFTRNETYQPWRYYYRQIYQANSIIDALGGTDFVPTTATDKSTIGQAKAMRAYAYFYLSQLYAKEYGDGTAKILPIYKSSKEESQPKSTAAQVWDFMILDLNQAITYLTGFTRTTKDQVNINVAKGLLSYVLAARGTQADWTQVATYTKDIMTAYPVTDSLAVVYNVLNGTSNPAAGFNNVATPSWIWGVDVTVASGINLVSFWGQVDYFTYSYAWAGDPKLIDNGLYALIPTNDRRKTQFTAPGALYPGNKFFDPRRITAGQRTVETDLVYQRADEFYLLNAEANARLGKEPEAKAALTSLLNQRFKNPTVEVPAYLTPLTGQALLDAIYLQTRIELWGEGKSYLAMKRNKATIKRGTNHLFDAGNSFAYNDPKLSFVIPQAEVLNNPNLNK
ncbi:MAG TPA: RagB/SusD family nutrient uptake outer membrane protein [Chitinophagaceae bacterium]|nr:RagB/SusD family nutrient uptake outer membrane protein [Chitinophagaceae bacterium]